VWFRLPSWNRDVGSLRLASQHQLFWLCREMLLRQLVKLVLSSAFPSDSSLDCGKIFRVPLYREGLNSESAYFYPWGNDLGRWRESIASVYLPAFTAISPIGRHSIFIGRCRMPDPFLVGYPVIIVVQAYSVIVYFPCLADRSGGLGRGGGFFLGGRKISPPGGKKKIFVFFAGFSKTGGFGLSGK